jgi:hypothetical protein
VPNGEIRRDIGPFILGLGGVIAMAGSIMPWATVRFRPRFIGVELWEVRDPVHHVMGTDLTDGKVTVAIAIVVALSGIAAIIATARVVRRWFARAGAVGGAVLLGAGLFELSHIGDVTRSIYNPFRGNPQLSDLRLHEYLKFSTGFGLVLLIVGGAIALFGAAVALAGIRWPSDVISEQAALVTAS